MSYKQEREIKVIKRLHVVTCKEQSGWPASLLKRDLANVPDSATVQDILNVADTLEWHLTFVEERHAGHE